MELLVASRNAEIDLDKNTFLEVVSISQAAHYTIFRFTTSLA